MSILSEADLTVEGGPYRMPGVYAAELGPYNRPLRFKVQAYTEHVKGGDGAWASMKLHYDGAQVGEDEDRKGGFNETTLEVNYEFYLSAGSSAQLRMETQNDKATVGRHGFNFWWAEG